LRLEVRSSFKILEIRNFRLFFIGQSVSLIGTWMSRLATSWLVYRLTGSAFLLGVVGFAGQIPTFFLCPIAGVWVDRLDRRKVLIITQIVAALQSAALAVLTLTNTITLWEVIALSAIQGVINAFDMPGRNAFLIDLVESRKNMKSAVALNSTMVNVARLAGPAIAGAVVAAAGEGVCFTVDAISYLAVIYSLLIMHIKPNPPLPGSSSMVDQLKDGWSYVSKFKPVRSLLILFAVIGFMGVPYSVLMPVFATKLSGGAGTLGVLMGAAGVGSLIGAVILTVRKSVRGLFRVVGVCAGLFGVGLIGFSFSHSFVLSVVCMAITGYGQIMQFTSTSTLIQTLVPDDKRGRVMSYWTMAYMGSVPLGSLLAGAMAKVMSAEHTVLLSGIGCMLGGLWFWRQLDELRPIVRPIYVEMGIIESLPITDP
jgi:MFS family permease